jgi:hypothetical protein
MTRTSARAVVVSLCAAAAVLAHADAALADRPVPAGAKLSAAAQAGASGAVSASAVYPGVGAEALANAIDVPFLDLVSADLMGSDPEAVAVAEPLGRFFPTWGPTFAILSTGLAADADTPNSSGSLSTQLGGIDNDQGNDLVRLHLRLRVPFWATCANLDFGYYSEEFPEWVGSAYNDTFTAQLDDARLSTAGNEVVAPGNFAFDAEGRVISVNTVFGFDLDTLTTYDGATPRLQASVSVVPESEVDLYLSIQDLGDSVYDSAVFLDNFFWSTGTTCASGSDADTDGDGLLDRWERHGLTVGGVHVDLPAMGADPERKDVFVEVDWMEQPGHSHRPDPAAIAAAVQAFADAPVPNPDGSTGVRLHVDYGPDAPLTWAPGGPTTWGALSRGEAVPHVDDLGGNILFFLYDWSAFDAIKAASFEDARLAAFHYNLWAHKYGGGTSSGLSRGIGASDFLVSLGAFQDGVGSVGDQTGTFMHELGHNLGLAHGGDDHMNHKPNYLSVMNYSFQLGGLAIGGTTGHYDYSRSRLPDLLEYDLDERAGIGTSSLYGTMYYCAGTARWDLEADRVDWNCDGDEDDEHVVSDINDDGPDFPLFTLGHDDWSSLVYTGGAIGSAGARVELPRITHADELTREHADTLPAAGARTVAIDVMPGSAVNPVNLKKGGVVPVALLGSAALDVAAVDGATVRFGRDGAAGAASALPLAREDVDGDGRLDLVGHFPLAGTGLAVGDTLACLSARTRAGSPLRGCDAVRVRG